MESFPFLLSPIVSSAYSVAFPPPSGIRLHQFFYSSSLACLAIILGAIYRTEEALRALAPDFPVIYVIGGHILFALLIISGMTIYLNSDLIRVKCRRLEASQQRIKEVLAKRDAAPERILLQEVDQLGRELGRVNIVTAGLAAVQYIGLIIILFPGIWIFMTGWKN